MWKEVRQSGNKARLGHFRVCVLWVAHRSQEGSIMCLSALATSQSQTASPRLPVTARGSFMPHVHHFKNSRLSLLAQSFLYTPLVLHRTLPPEERALGNLDFPIWLCQGSCPRHVSTINRDRADWPRPLLFAPLAQNTAQHSAPCMRASLTARLQAIQSPPTSCSATTRKLDKGRHQKTIDELHLLFVSVNHQI